MNVTVERIPESQVRLEIVADQEEQDRAIDKAIQRVAREATIPGFRKGKAPRSMIERMYGREAFAEEANRDLIEELFREAVKQESLQVVGEPELDSIEPDPLSFVVRVPVYPVVETGDYASVRIEPVDAAVGDSDVEAMLSDMQRAESPWVDPAEPRKAIEGDQVTLDIEIMDGDEAFGPKNEDAVFVIGESNLLSELADVIATLEVGESGSADIEFGEDDDRYREDDPRRGKTMTYYVTLKGVKEKDLLPLDDEFAVTYGNNVDSLEALRERLRTNLHVQRTRESRTSAVSAIIEQLHTLAEFDVPAAMVDDAVDERLNNVRSRLSYSGIPLEAYLRQTGQTEEALRDDLREQAERDLRTSLILREIANKEGISVTDEDLDAEIEDLVAGAPEAEEMRQAYGTNAYLRSTIRNDLFDQRLTDFLIDIATEGKGAVLNGFVPEVPDAPDQDVASGKAEEAPGSAGAEPGEGSPASSSKSDENDSNS